MRGTPFPSHILFHCYPQNKWMVLIHLIVVAQVSRDDPSEKGGLNLTNRALLRQLALEKVLLNGLDCTLGLLRQGDVLGTSNVSDFV